MVEVLFLPARGEDQCRSNPPSIGSLTLQRDFEKVMCVVFRLDILVDGRRRVDVVDDEIELAVVIEVGVGRAVREARLVQSPVLRHVRERQIPVVPEDVVGHAVTVQLLQQRQRSLGVSRTASPEHGRLVLQIVHRLGITARDEDVLGAVIVEIHQQGGPAPIRVGHARETADLTEDDVAVGRESIIQLQRVDVVVVAKPSAAQLHLAFVRDEAAHPLACAQRGRHHVDLEDVGPAVVVEIGDIDAHAGEARVLEPGSCLVGERSVPVVDVQDVVGCDVVGDIDVGPSIPVDVGHDHPESIPDLPQNPCLARYVREGPIAVVSIEFVVAGRAVTTHPERVRLCCTTGKVLG